MTGNRRAFLSNAVIGRLAASAMNLTGCRNAPTKAIVAPDLASSYDQLDKILYKPIFKKELFSSAVIIKSVELLRFGKSFLCRVRSADGAEGISVAHGDLKHMYPIPWQR